MNIKKILLLIFVTMLFFPSCYYNKEEKLYGIPLCDTSNVKYSVQIMSTLAGNCLRCHGGNAAEGGGILLADYNVLKTYALNGRLLGALQQAPGYTPMPKGGARLPDCLLAEIRTWIRNGAPNN